MNHSTAFARGALKGGTALSTLAILGAGLALATPAFAQDSQDSATQPTGPVEAAPPSTAQTAPGGSEEIIVTGSRIPQAPNLTSSAPVTVVGQQDIKLTGTTRIEDTLNQLPQVSAGQASGVSNGATGIATVDLRGLGSVRTLVLVDGRRLLPGDPTDSSADLNAIPDFLVKRVEVLTGGASSTYGADAVAGVVNFIMDDSFEGIRLDGTYSAFQHNNNNKVMPPLLDARAAVFPNYEYPTGSKWDGGNYNLNAAIGAGFDDNRGHVLGYFGYRHTNPVKQDARDFSACTLQNRNQTTLQCGGSAISAEGNIALFNNDTTEGTSTVFTVGTDRTIANGLTRFNFAPYNYFQRDDTRYTGGVFAKYEVNDAIQPYLEFMFMDDQTHAQIAPSGDFGNTLTVNCDNPLMSAQEHNIICEQPENLVTGFLGNYPLTPVTNTANPDAPPLVFVDPVTGQPYNKAYFQLLRRNVEGGPRIADLEHTEYRGVIGSKGDLGSTWSYDAYYQYGKTNYSQVYENEFSAARLTRALDVVQGPNGPVCRSTLTGDDPNCVPYDIFSQGAASQAAVNYLNVSGFQHADLTEKVLSASFTGRLGDYGVKLPWAEDGVTINVGGEYRKEAMNLKVDALFDAGDLTGQGAPTKAVKGDFNVKELFGEIQIPVVEDIFSLNGGYRYSKYNLSNDREFSTNTWRIAGDITPIKDIKIRGNINRAVRAPNIQELFAPIIVALDGSNDPCAGFEITADDVGCLAQGLRLGQSVAGNPAAQYNGQIGGNPNLLPEKALTKTLGVVLQPRFVPRLAITVDWYNIKVEDAIQGFGADAVVNFCAATADPFACSLVHRNPVGSLWLTPDGYVVDLNRNIGSIETSGIDVGASYAHEIGNAGTLSLSFQGTWLDKFKVDNGLTEPYDCAGYYGTFCSVGQGGSAVPSAPNAEWRHKARATFNMDNGIGVSVQWRYFGSVKVDYSNPSSTLNAVFDDFSSKLGSENWFDLAFTYAAGKNYNFRAGVNNIFDNEPPLVSSGRSDGSRSQCPTGPCNGNTYPGTYDALGRYFFIGATLDF